ARVDAQLFGGTGTSDDRIDQEGSGVVGRSSSKGGGGGGVTWDPKALGAPNVPDGPAGGGGGGLQILACGLHEICMNRFPTCAGEESLSYQPP
nr:hypothetical protein [Tanacetum cinerariifolium]